MSSTIPGKRYGALHAWREGDDWHYLPVVPSPQRAPNGHIMLTAIETGDILALTIGTVLIVSEAQLAQAQAVITAEIGNGAAPVRLHPANATPRGATLTFTPDGGSPVELARANPSPMPPYSAAFSALLRGDQAGDVNAAMKGGTGRLDVAYDFELARTRAVTATLIGDPGDSDDIEAALANGNLVLTIDADDAVSDELKTEARRRVIEEATRLLNGASQKTAEQTSIFGDCHNDGTPDPATGDPNQTTTTTATIETEVTLTEPAPHTVRLTANVADWLKDQI